MAHIIYYKLWESDFESSGSKEDEVEDMNNNQSKLKVHDSYKEKEKLTTNFKAANDSDVINKAYLDEKLLKIDGHLTFLEKDCFELKLHYNKQSVEEILIRRAVETAIPTLYDKCLFDFSPNADKILRDYMFVTRDRIDLDSLIDNVQRLCLSIRFEK